MRSPHRRHYLAGALLAALSSAAAANTPTPPLQQFTLDNGLRVYLREDHRAPLVVSQLWYHVGSSYEPPGQSGLSHALEHLMFEGSSKIAPGQYSRILSRLGAEENAFTLDDATVFHQTLPVSRLEVALEAMADAMGSARLGETEFDREIDVVMAERRTHHDDDPFVLTRERSQALAYSQSSYRTPMIGYRHDLERMTVNDLRNWHQAWFHPNNATLVIVGDITLSQLRPLVERQFAALRNAELPASRTPRELDPPGERRLEVTLPGLNEGVSMRFNTPSLATAESPAPAYALSLLPHLLTEGVSSRLTRKLAREEALLTYISSDYSAYQRGDSLFSLHAFPNAQKQISLRQAEDAIWNLIEDLRQSPPSAQELQRAKARLTSSMVFERDSMDRQADAIGIFAASGLDPTLLDTEIHEVQKVSALQIQEAVRDYLTRDRLTVTYMHDKERTHE